ncbi:MAG: phage integrase SAM-like domain-containing protein [Mangrovibacterium sp.]
MINEKLTGKVENKTPFFETFDIVYERMKKELGERRAQTIRNTSNRIREFRPDLTFGQVDRQFYRELMSYLEGRDFMQNYIGSIIRDLKKVMEYAKDQGVHENLEFKLYIGGAVEKDRLTAKLKGSGYLEEA